MSNRNDGGPAFPVEHTHDGMPWVNPGMSLRDWFAGKALAEFANLVTLKTDDDALTRGTMKVVAEYSYWLADAMLAERAKSEART